MKKKETLTTQERAVTDGEVSTATDAPDDGAPSPAIGKEKPAKPAKKYGKAGSKRGKTK